MLIYTIRFKIFLYKIKLYIDNYTKGISVKKETSYEQDVCIYRYWKGKVDMNILYIDGKFIGDASIHNPIEYGCTDNLSTRILKDHLTTINNN